jgi:hypothetical protein
MLMVYQPPRPTRAGGGHQALGANEEGDQSRRYVPVGAGGNATNGRDRPDLLHG